MKARARTPSPSRPRLSAPILTVLLASLALLMTALGSATASAAPPVFWQSQVGQIVPGNPGARGVAADPDNGHVYVSDQAGHQIVEFTAWGTSVKSWGWDVVASGPGDDTVAPEDQFEICVPANGDVCKVGIAGTGGAGQFNSAMGMAVDSAGNVYAAEAGAPRRVQKFSSSGQFLLSFGGGVNQGGGTPENPGNVCTATHLANGDVCGAGETGTGPGEFSGTTGALRTVIAVTPDDKVYVGDKDRIQRFNTAGVYQAEIAVPGEGVQQVAVDSAGFLYVSYEKEGAPNDAKPNVRKLDPTTGAELLTFTATNPRAIAVAPNGEVYVSDYAIAKIRHFAPGGAELEAFGEGLSESTGIAVNDVTCAGGIAIYPTSALPSPSFVRAYSPVPDPDCVGPPPSVPPTIAEQGATSVSSTEATLQVKINPHFWLDTRYYASYATAACIEAGGWEAPCVSEQPAPPGALLNAGVSSTAVARSLDLDGLAPDTAYRFRFAAESSGGGPAIGPERAFTTYRTPANNTSCPNQAFRNGPAARLPDCRAYEMVSPVDKNGGDVLPFFHEGFDADFEYAGLDRATPEGDKLTYTSAAVFAQSQGGPIYSQYLASRDAGGWTTESVNPPMKGGVTNGVLNATSQFKAFSEDLCEAWLNAEAGKPLVPGPTEGFRNLYRRDNCAAPPAYTWMESSAPEPEPCIDLGCDVVPYLFPDLQGVAREGECVAFRVNDALTEEAPRGVPLPVDSRLTAPQLYLRCEGTEVRLASVLPSGAPFEGLSSAGTEEGSLGGFIGGGSRGEGHADTVENALSEDGTRLYWTASSETPPRLYLRINADKPQSAVSGGACTQPSRACTLAVSPSANKAQFWTASSDGSRAIFSITGGPLTGNLYEYELATKSATPIAKESLGVAGASEDLSRLYFASKEICSGAGENSEGDTAQAGQPNLYLYEAGESCAAGEMELVGTLEADEISSGGGNSGFPSPVASVPRSHVARATPDGSHLAFVSAAPLTDYDNTDIASGELDREVYLYDAGSGKLRCASCDPSGARPQGANLDRGGGNALWVSAYVPGYQHQLYGRRLISEDGGRLFFNSLDALLPQDINEAMDVYQWEAPGTGDCTTASPTYSTQNGGCVALISSGESAEDSEFVEASPSGDDVFIRTSSSLDPRDPGSIDIYDARVGGGIAIPGAPAACEGEACQSPPSAPNDPTPASSAFAGPGNLAKKAARKRCPKGKRKVRRAGKKARCVKRKRNAKDAHRPRAADKNRRAPR